MADYINGELQNEGPGGDGLTTRQVNALIARYLRDNPQGGTDATARAAAAAAQMDADEALEKAEAAGRFVVSSGLWTPTVSDLVVTGIASGSPQGTLSVENFGWVGDSQRKVFSGFLTWTPPANNTARITGIEAILTLPTGFRITDFFGQVFWNYVEHTAEGAFYGDNQGAGNLFVASDNKTAPFTKILLDSEFDNAFATPYKRTGVIEGWMTTAAAAVSENIVVGVYDDTDGEIDAQNQTFPIPSLPASIEVAASPLATKTSNQRWFVRVPAGVWIQHWHLGSIANDDPGWRLDTSYTGAGRRYLSSALGSDATTMTIQMFIDLISGT